MRSILAPVVFAAVAASGQAFAQSAASDPLESINRAIYGFNSAFSTAVSAPVADAYRTMLPAEVQTGLDNVFTNLRQPVTVVSAALQGYYANSGNAAMRFAINSTLGIGGVFDVATGMGWTDRPTDLGTVLCSYDVAAGPYLVLPFLGPSTVRDTVGLGATYWATFGLLDDWGTSYLVADAAVSRTADGVPDPKSSYEEQRDAYLAFREELCDGILPDGTLKASPLGRTVLLPGGAAASGASATEPPAVEGAADLPADRVANAMM